MNQLTDLAPSGGWPVTVSGWATLIGVTLTACVVLWDRIVGKGRAETKVSEKLDALCRQLEDMEGRLTVVDGLATTVKELVYEWRGIDGQNGYKSIIRESQKRLTDVELRNHRLDAIRQEDERRSGGLQRRLIDRELNNLLPEKREHDP